MLRSLLFATLLAALLGSAPAQDSMSNVPDPQTGSNPQAAPSAQPSDQNQQQSKKKPNKVKEKLGDLLPDCTNLIFFHGCRAPKSEDDKDDRKQQQRLQDATQRCQQLTAALPPSMAHRQPAPSSNASAGESSSRAASQPDIHPYCMPEDVLAADHDVDVGDFYFAQQNFRAAEMRYRSALERLPGEPIASLHLARLLEKLGNKSEAADHYKAFLEWSPTGKDADEAKAAVERLQKKTAQK
jgi:tetratricopeptide (TPR) repeat protein